MIYYAQFYGELAGNSRIEQRFVKQYNRWVDLINSKQESLNQLFEELYEDHVEPNIFESDLYETWMLGEYRKILKDSKLDTSWFMTYEIGDELQFYGIGRFGKHKNKQIGFTLRKG